MNIDPALKEKRIALFVPCFIDASYPQVGIATLELLEKLGLKIEYPFDQTCCGQPLANEGAQAAAAKAEANFARCFQGYDYIVAPSASCVHHVRSRFDSIEQTDAIRRMRQNTYDIVEFLHDIVKVFDFPWASFPHKVNLHQSCTSLRSLKPPHGSMSELAGPEFSKPMKLLAGIKGISFVTLERQDECCGFGGLFAVFEEAVSSRMGYDKVEDQTRAGAEYIVSADTSCLMHQEGCARRMQRPLKYLHIAEVLNGVRT